MEFLGTSTRDSPSCRWELQPALPTDSQALATTLSVTPLLAQLLLNRGITDSVSAQAFLHPTMGSLPDPRDLPDMAAAVARLRTALGKREQILIHGDYDVDGLSGSALLQLFLRTIGHEVEVFIPDRLADGYGLRVERIAEFAERGFKLIITVDTGTSAHAAIARARELGVDVIVTDHHEPPPVLPAGACVLNPKRVDSRYPFPLLAGTGVAFHFAWAMARDLCGSDKVTPELRAFLVDSLSLVALATVADVMPLVGVNRVLVTEGLRSLARTRNPGLQALMQVAGGRPEPLTPEYLAFQVAPRLNAAGRMGKGELAHELLTTTSPARAHELAQMLDDENRQRRGVERQIFDMVVQSVEKEPEDAPVLVLGGSDWHTGVIGIVASRLVERYQKPALLAAFDATGLGRGSCRSIPGFPLHEALAHCGEHLLKHGGHAMAAGFEVREGAAFEAFKTAILEYGRTRLSARPPAAPLNVDAEISLADLSESVLDHLRKLHPHGQGNPAPLFLARGIRVAGRARRVGKSGDHLSFMARQDGKVVRAIAFGCGGLLERVEQGPFEAVFAASINEFAGQRNLQIEIKDIH